MKYTFQLLIFKWEDQTCISSKYSALVSSSFWFKIWNKEKSATLPLKQAGIMPNIVIMNPIKSFYVNKSRKHIVPLGVGIGIRPQL